jgi:hypothetical protein
LKTKEQREGIGPMPLDMLSGLKVGGVEHKVFHVFSVGFVLTSR